jgi:NADPH-dependent 2,4-dienoyl-CoA reductase/sulfur reductase-like enzyme
MVGGARRGLKSRMDTCQVAVVGGGPAGIMAALVAARAGAKVAIIEEQKKLGGHYYKQPPVGWSFDRSSRFRRQQAEGRRLIDSLAEANVRVLTNTLAWDLFESHRLALANDDQVWQLAFEKLIIATGAWEAPIAVPGWTLPGVITGGAAQNLISSQGLIPGRRIILMGAGPFQLRIASQLVENGARVVALLDAAPTTSYLRNLLRLMPYWTLLPEIIESLARIGRAGVRVLPSHLPIRIQGDGHVERVVASRVDGDWKPVPGSEVTFDVDTVCLTYGFVPSVEVARLAGCRIDYRSDSGGWTVWHDSTQNTSVKDLLVAGDGGDIEGGMVASLEGQLAGLEAARQLGIIGRADCRSRLRSITNALSRTRPSVRVLQALSTVKPGAMEAVSEDTVLCRCEDVLAGTIRKVCGLRGQGLRDVKLKTRAGMGHCQGRICGHLISRYIAYKTQTEVEAVTLDTPRPPVRPVSVAALTGLQKA